MRIILWIFILFLLSTCNKKDTRQDFVKKYKNENFSQFDNLYIGIRQSNKLETTYMVCRDNLPPYFVTQSNLTNEISVNRNLLLKLNKSDYLNERQIKNYISHFKKYPISAISVDSSHNVYITHNGDSLTLLRVADFKNIDKKYKKIYENWYIEK